jgi:hypothetical protein
MAPRRRGRGRLSAIDLLPEAASEAIAWAAGELARRDRTQTEIHAEFAERLAAIRAETGLSFDTPSFSAFNRYSVRLADMTRRLEQTREIAATISDRFDAETSDDLTLMAAEAIKSLVFEVLQGAGEAGVSPKGAMELAAALRSAVQAQSVSAERRRRVEAEFAQKADKALDKVAKARGLSAETVSDIKARILGVA